MNGAQLFMAHSNSSGLMNGPPVYLPDGDDYKILKVDKWVKATGNEFIKILKK